MSNKIFNSGDTIPKDSAYRAYINGFYKLCKSGKKFPDAPGDKDRFYHEDYDYVYEDQRDGWRVSLMDKGKMKYTDILESICGKPIVDVSNLFKGCTKMVKAPNIPNGVKYMNHTFEGCSKLRYNINMPIGIPTAAVISLLTIY